PRRKIDPGEKFPWARLAAAGIGHWATPAPVNGADAGIARDAAGPLVAAGQARLGGYWHRIQGAGGFGPGPEVGGKGFQRHFRPDRVDGRIDQSTITTLERLSAALARRTSSV